MEKTWQQIKKELFDPYRFNLVSNDYITSQKVKVQLGCNAITYTNLGDTIVTVNNITLFPSATPATVAGDSISIGGNLGEIYKGDINVKFLLPLGAAPRLQIIQKFYILFEE